MTSSTCRLRSSCAVLDGAEFRLQPGEYTGAVIRERALNMGATILAWNKGLRVADLMEVAVVVTESGDTEETAFLLIMAGDVAECRYIDDMVAWARERAVSADTTERRYRTGETNRYAVVTGLNTVIHVDATSEQAAMKTACGMPLYDSDDIDASERVEHVDEVLFFSVYSAESGQLIGNGGRWFVAEYGRKNRFTQLHSFAQPIDPMVAWLESPPAADPAAQNRGLPAATYACDSESCEYGYHDSEEMVYWDGEGTVGTPDPEEDGDVSPPQAGWYCRACREGLVQQYGVDASRFGPSLDQEIGLREAA